MVERRQAGSPASHYREKAYELLADGEWHDYNKVLTAVTARVHPAQAYRRALHRQRLRTQQQPTDEKARQALVRSGQREMARLTLGKKERFEQRTTDGRREIRLLPFAKVSTEAYSEASKAGWETKRKNHQGRLIAPYMQRALDVCSDGRWHLRDDVVAKMVELVPRDAALRRGLTLAKGVASTEEKLILRGARHRCQVALNSSVEFTSAVRGGKVFVRWAALDPPPSPIVFEPATDKTATHVVVPIDVYHELDGVPDEVQYVRTP